MSGPCPSPICRPRRLCAPGRCARLRRWIGGSGVRSCSRRRRGRARPARRWSSLERSWPLARRVGGGRLPDRAADSPVGAGREPAGGRARAGRRLAPPAAGVRWCGGHIRAHRQGPGPVGARSDRADAGDRRLSAPPGGGAHVGGGVREGVWWLRAVAVVVWDAISLRRDPDPRCSLRLRRARATGCLLRLGGCRTGWDLPAGVLCRL